MLCALSGMSQKSSDEAKQLYDASESSALKELLPPENLTATLIDGNDVKLEWESPVNVGTWLQWDIGLNYGSGIGLANGGTFFIASCWDEDDLVPYIGMVVNKYSFIPVEDPDAVYELMAWTGDEEITVIMTQSVPAYTLNEWNEFELDNPISVDSSTKLWLGYSVTHVAGVNPAGRDEGPAVSGKGDMISSSGVTWLSMNNDFGWNYNWNFAAFVSPSDGKYFEQKMIEMPNIEQEEEQFVTSQGFNDPIIFNPALLENFTGYNVYRDDVIIAEQYSQNYFIDFNLPPQTYSYDVKAIYDEGTSDGAGPVELKVPDGIDRQIVIVEMGTGTWCGYCPGAAMAADEMVINGLNVGVIEYHYNDDYATDESTDRLSSYYNVLGYPTTFFDGVLDYQGGSSTESVYEDFYPRYIIRSEIPSLFVLDAYHYNLIDNIHQLNINIEMVDEYPFPEHELVVQAVVTESHIEEEWGGGIMDELNYVCRDMIPDQHGTELSLIVNNTQYLTLDFVIPEDYNTDHLEVIVFIQDNNTKEVLQGTISQMSITDVSDEQTLDKVNIYPNPANNRLNINNARNCKVLISEMTGKVIKYFSIDDDFSTHSISDLKDGIYLIKVINNENSSVINKKLMVQ